MNVMQFSLISLLLTAYLWVKILGLKGFVSISLSYFLFLCVQIVVIGFIASWFQALSNTNTWVINSILLFILTVAYSTAVNREIYNINIQHVICVISNTFSNIIIWTKDESTFFEKTVLFFLLTTFMFTTIVNLITVINVAPHNWDSMTYHLAQIPYFLQNNSLAHFGSNYWAQDVHPKNSAILKIYTYLVTGQSENLMQLVQFSAYIISGISIYGISRLIGGNKYHSLVSALIFSLLTESLMESITTQNDMLITALVGIMTYFMLLWGKCFHRKYLLLIGLAAGLALGIKSSFLLVLPSLALLFLFLLYKAKAKRIRSMVMMSLFASLSVLVLAAPAGYVENIKEYGHPIGPKSIRAAHSFEGRTLEYIMNNGSKNVLRFGFDFLSTDGLPPIQSFNMAQYAIRIAPKKILPILGINIEGKEGCRVPFSVGMTSSFAHEDRSSWGVFGFTIIWPSIILSLLGFIKSSPIRILSLSTVLFVLIQSYVGPYDPWRGRYFLIATIFAVPIVIGILNYDDRFIKGVFLLIIIIGSMSAVSSVIFRENSPVIDFHYQNISGKSIYRMNRLEQLTRNRGCYNDVFDSYERIVPKYSTVATILGGDEYEYPLFGEFFSRTIMPLNGFDSELLAIPESAEYLYYDSRLIKVKDSDIYLGCDVIYLRDLVHDKERHAVLPK